MSPISQKPGGLKAALGKPPVKPGAKPPARPQAPQRPAAKAPAARPQAGKPAPRPNAQKPQPRRGPSHDELADEAFEGIKGAKVQVDSNYERPGHYIERIDRCELKKNRSSQTNLIISKTVLAVLAEDEAANAHRVGEEVSHVVPNHGAQKDYFLPTVKKFISTVIEADPEAIDVEDCRKITNPQKQPLAGYVVECFNVNKVSKANKDFTKIQYKRRVPFAELSNYLDEETIEFFYPNGALAGLIESEGGTVEPPAESQGDEDALAANFDEEQPVEDEGSEDTAVEEELAGEE